MNEKVENDKKNISKKAIEELGGKINLLLEKVQVNIASMVK